MRRGRGSFIPPRRVGAHKSSEDAGRGSTCAKAVPLTVARSSSSTAAMMLQRRGGGGFVAPQRKQLSKTPVSSASKLSIRLVFAALHTKRSNKKRKSYDDGIVLFEKGKVMLYDMVGKIISKSMYKLKQEALPSRDDTLQLGSKDVELAEPLNIGDYDSGRLFLSTTATASKSSSSTVNVHINKKFRSLKTPATGGQEDQMAQHSRKARQSIHSATAPDALVLMPATADGILATVVDPQLARQLRPHQRAGVQFMFNCITANGNDSVMYKPNHTANPTKTIRGQTHGCILADEMGLGKTLQCIALLWTVLYQGPYGLRPWCYKAVVVTPSSLTQNWANEFRKWLGIERIKPLVVNGGGDQAKQTVETFAKTRINRVLIISYEMFRKHAKTLNSVNGVDLIICDEGHRLKSASGNQTIRALSACKTSRRVLLTGTPVQNELNEFFAMVDFVNPGALGSNAKSFKRIFQTPIERGIDKSADADERVLAQFRSKELEDLTTSFILRRTSEINQKFLPPRTDINIFVKLGKAQEVAYKSIVDSSFISLSRTSKANSGTEALQMIHQLRQVCTHPQLLTKIPEPTDLQQTSGKLHLLQVLLKEIRSNNPSDRIVLVSNSTKTLDVIQKLCDMDNHVYLRLDGSTNSSNRQTLVNQFNNPSQSGRYPVVFLLSAKAGGCGLNLIGANRLVLMDLDWNPATDHQAAARIWRDGQRKQVYIYRFISTGTIEERVFQRQDLKLSSAQSILKAGRAKSRKVQLGRFSKVDLKKLFEYKEFTDCDTYDLMVGDNSSKCCWKAYEGPSCLSDPVMRRAVEKVGNQVVSFVHSALVDHSAATTAEEAQEKKISFELDDSDSESEDGFDSAGEKENDCRRDNSVTVFNSHEEHEAETVHQHC